MYPVTSATEIQSAQRPPVTAADQHHHGERRQQDRACNACADEQCSRPNVDETALLQQLTIFVGDQITAEAGFEPPHPDVFEAFAQPRETCARRGVCSGIPCGFSGTGSRGRCFDRRSPAVKRIHQRTFGALHEHDANDRQCGKQQHADRSEHQRKCA